MMGTYGKPCAWCGARLDPGERCDCTKTDQEAMKAKAAEKHSEKLQETSNNPYLSFYA